MSLQASADGDADWDAATYDRVADPQTRWGERVLARLPLRGDEVVIDAGCGTGRVTERVLARLPRGTLLAVDASAAMLEQARRRLAGHGDGRVRFIQADLLALTAADLVGAAPVDAVFSTATFHWVLDHERLFANLASVLRPGGRLVAQCGAAGNIERLTALVRRLGVERPGSWLYASVDDTRARLFAAGFDDIEVWANEEPTEFDDGLALSDFLEAVCLREGIATLTPEARRRFLGDVVAGMPDRVIDYVRLNILATRA